MNPIRGVTGTRLNYRTKDGRKFTSVAVANEHQRNLNSAERVKKLAKQYKLLNALDVAVALRNDMKFRKRFMLAVNH